MLMPTPPPCHLGSLLNAGFEHIVPVLPISGDEQQDFIAADGSPVKFTPIADGWGKAPGKINRAGRWQLRSRWADYVPTDDDVYLHDYHRCNAGLILGDPHLAVDVDVIAADLAGAIRAEMSSVWSQFRVGAAPKFAGLIRLTDGAEVHKVVLDLGEAGKIELLGTGQQIVMAGIHPGTQAPYEWQTGAGAPTALIEALAPRMTADGVRAWLDRLTAVCEAHGHPVTRTDHQGPGKAGAGGVVADPPSLGWAHYFLSVLPNNDKVWDHWADVMRALKTDYGDAARDAFLDWSRKADKHVESNAIREWSRYKPNGTKHFASVLYQMRHVDGIVLPGEVENAWRADLAHRSARKHLELAPLPPAVAEGAGAGEMTVLDIESCLVLDPATVEAAAAFKKAGDPRYGLLEERARAGRSLTDFKKAVKAVFRRQANDRMRARETKRKFFDVTDANFHLALAERLERTAAARELAFSFGGNPVVLRRMETSENTHSTTARVIRVPDLKRIASTLGYYQRKAEDGTMLPVDAPISLIQQLDACMGNSLKALQGISAHPVMFNGELMFGDGRFHAETGLYLDTGSLEVRQWADPVEAYKFLTETWLGDFSFKTDLDRAKALMLPASLLVAKTHMLNQPGPPIFLDSAPFPGSGKSFRISVCHAAITGSPAPTSIYPDNPDEREKVVVASIMAGQTHLAFDNLKSGTTIGNSHHVLAQLTTTPMFEGRILGVSKKFVGPAGLVPSLTGNNVIFSGDMISRGVEVRHDPGHGVNLATRSFRHDDLMSWTIENRGWIIGAFACVMQAKGIAKPPGRFSVWSRVVADPILAVAGTEGFYDPWLEAGDSEAVSPSSPSFVAFLQYLYPLLDGEWHTAGEIADRINANAQLRLQVFDETTNVTAKVVSAYLRRHDGWTGEGRKLWSGRHNLGDRTKREKRLVFTVT